MYGVLVDTSPSSIEAMRYSARDCQGTGRKNDRVWQAESIVSYFTGLTVDINSVLSPLWGFLSTDKWTAQFSGEQLHISQGLEETGRQNRRSLIGLHE